MVREEGLPPLSAIASVGCVAGAGLPTSCSPAALATCVGTAILWAPAAHTTGHGFQQNPARAAASFVAYAAKQLERSKKLKAVVAIVPQAAPGQSRWARWWPLNSANASTEVTYRRHVVGHVEHAFGGGHWGGIVLTKAARAENAPVWVRTPPPLQAPPFPPPPLPAKQEELLPWLYNPARSWVVICDSAALPPSRRPVVQQLQERVLAALGLEWLNEDALTVLPLNGRMATLRLHLCQARDRLRELADHCDADKYQALEESVRQVARRCIGWDSTEIRRLACEQRCWLVDGAVCTTVHAFVDGSVPAGATGKCGGWATCGACWELAGSVRIALPRSSVAGCS